MRKVTIALTALLVLAVIPIYSAKVLHKTDYTDFGVYYLAAQRAKSQNWTGIYSLTDGASPFRYAPVTLPFFRPLAELPPTHARMLWFYLQFAFFTLGFVYIYRSLLALKSNALWITCVTVLFTLRFCLDTFTIGQVSSLMFLGFSVGLYGWVTGKTGLAGTGVFIPSLFKIGPGFIYFLMLRTRAIFAAAASLFGLGVLTLIWCGSWERYRMLWANWSKVVANDSVYYDASHYGSQSVKSAILRMVNSGWLSPSQGSSAYLALAVIGCLIVLSFWLIRRPRSAYGKGLFFSLGLFPYLWFMPETFKYSLTVIALPVALLLSARKKSALSGLALVFCFAVLSLAGKDIVGDTVFFGLQRASVPLFATFLLFTAVFQQAWSESKSVIGSTEELSPWPRLPSPPDLAVSLLLPVPSNLHSAKLNRFLDEAHTFFRSHWPGDYEILTPAQTGTRGAALREAFLAARGRAIFVGHIEQPCHFTFFEEAYRLLEQGYEFVRANRRLNETKFIIPVRLLPLVYGRHRLGLIFNRLVRLFLPIQTTDTHSGTFVMSRKLAGQAFALQTSTTFLFDLEIALTSIAHGYREKDLPVTLSLSQEKSSRRIMREMFIILTGLPTLIRRFRLGYYDPYDARPNITADDWGLSPAVNRGILELAKKGVIRRVSLLADGKYLQHNLDELRAIPEIQLGLHFNLTYAKKYSSPAVLLVKWLLPWGNRTMLLAYVREELTHQLAKLQEAGIKPVYLDGHHHIHMLPGLLSEIADQLETADIKHVRLPYDPALWLSSKIPLLVLTLLARSTFMLYGFKYGRFFYPRQKHFLDHGSFRAKLNRLARSSQSDIPPEIIVHPAERADAELWERPDDYVEGRVTEYQSLRMLAFVMEESA